MPTLKVTSGNIQLTSSWKARKKMVYIGTQSYGYTKWVFESGPSTGTAKVQFKYTLPSGANIKSAKIWANLSSPPSGCAVRTVNGKNFTENRGTEKGVKIDLPGTSGTFEANFAFKANGTKTDTNIHYATLSVTNLYLEIDYTIDVTPPSDTPYSGNSDIFQPPPQDVCIIDPTEGSIYTFDGVTKVGHALSMDIQEEPDKNKDKYVNNAKNEPDKLTLDVIMSDVYTGGTLIDMDGLSTSQQSNALSQATGAIVHDGYTRSETYFYGLHWLKEQRRKLTVITPQFVYTEMIIASITVNRDSNCPYGWEGQIVLQHAFEPKKKKQTVTSGAKTGSDRPDASTHATILVPDSNGDTQSTTPAASMNSSAEVTIQKVSKGRKGETTQ